MTYTEPKTYVSGQIYTSAEVNTYVSGNTGYLKGRILAQWWPEHALRAGGSTQGNPARGPLPLAGSNWAGHYFEFAAAEAQTVWMRYAAPPSLVGDTSPVIRVIWDTTATAGNVRWEAAMATVGDNEEVLTPTFIAAARITTVPTTAARRITTTLEPTLVVDPNDLVLLGLTRTGDDVLDSCLEAVHLHYIALEAG